METPNLESVLAFIAFQPNDLHRDATAELVALHALLTRHEAMRAALERIVAADVGMDYRMYDSAIEEARALLDTEKPEAGRGMK